MQSPRCARAALKGCARSSSTTLQPADRAYSALPSTDPESKYVTSVEAFIAARKQLFKRSPSLRPIATIVTFWLEFGIMEINSKGLIGLSVFGQVRGTDRHLRILVGYECPIPHTAVMSCPFASRPISAKAASASATTITVTASTAG